MGSEDDRRERLRQASYLRSSSREALIEHVFIAEVLQDAWFGREQVIEVLRSEVDAAGYDVVFECGAVVRHVQLKASERGGKTARQTINVRLAEKPSGCVVWVVYSERPLEHRLDLSYLWFGGAPGSPLPTLGGVVGRNPRSKTPRPGTRVVPRAAFEPVPTTTQLLDRLVGAGGTYRPAASRPDVLRSAHETWRGALPDIRGGHSFAAATASLEGRCPDPALGALCRDG